jgi:hypothetical protein
MGVGCIGVAEAEAAGEDLEVAGGALTIGRGAGGAIDWRGISLRGVAPWLAGLGLVASRAAG